MPRREEQQFWGWWTVDERMNEFQRSMGELVPDPRNYRLLEINREYTIDELRALLQNYGSYLASLNAYKGIVKGHVHGLKHSFNEAMKIAVAELGGRATVTAREGEVLASNEVLADARRIQIEQEAVFEAVDGWIDAYQIAWDTISRLITVHQGEIALQLNRSV